MKKVPTSVRLKQLMEERHLKQIDILRLTKPLCEKYDVRLEKNDLSQYVAGKTEPGQYKLFILAKALNVNETWLMGLEVPMERFEAQTTKQDPEPPILTKYNKLNNKGKEKTDSYVDDLLESPKYVASQKYIVYGEENKSYPAVAAPDITPARANPKKKQIKHSN